MNLLIPQEDDNEKIEFKDALPNVKEEPELIEPGHFRHPFAFSPPRDRLKRFRKEQRERDFQNTDHLLNDNFDYKNGCIICRTNFTPDDSLFSLNCGHTFHTDEIKLWFDKNDSCPICMKPHTGVENENDFELENDNMENDDMENLYGYPIGGDSYDFTADDEVYLPPSPEPPSLEMNPYTSNMLNDWNLNSTIEFNCRISSIRDKKKMTFLVLQYNSLEKSVSKSHKIQGLIFKENLSEDEIDVLKSLTPESVIRLTGKLIKSPVEIKSTDLTYRDREIHIEHVDILSVSDVLPIQIHDLNNYQKGNYKIDVGQDSRLNHRIIDLRSDQKQAIFQLQSLLSQYMRMFLYDNGFMEIHTPKLISASSEGGSEVFKFDYFGTPAFLAQSPQLYKQMVINSNFPRIFEVGPVFRAEKSNTKRHLTEFTGFDIEMRIENDYEEILDLFYELLATSFSKLYQNHSDLIYQATGSSEFSLELKKCIITYREAVMLLNNNLEESQDPIGFYDDLTHAQEYKLGKLVKKMYCTDLFILDKFPMKIRPFYTMPNEDGDENIDNINNDSNELYSKSYDIIFRGQEILSGAQRINDYDMLIKQAKEKGLSQESIDSMGFYINSFKYGSYPHGGGGFGLERLLANFLGLDEIRMVSMFPRDPKRINP